MHSQTGGVQSPSPRTISYSKVVDLTHVIHPGMPCWPGDPPVRFQRVAKVDTDGFYLRRFSMGEHSGTHMNAPRSFYPNGATIDTYAAESLVAPALVIDMRDQAEADPDHALTTQELASWEGRYGLVPPGALVFLYTGWQHKWNDPQEFLGLDHQGSLHFPGFGYDAAQILMQERGAAGLGTDTLGLEPGQDKQYTVNRLALMNKGLVLESLANLDRLPATGATLIVGPLRLEGGSGAPVSVLALVP